jgi:hypothetical protein
MDLSTLTTIELVNLGCSLNGGTFGKDPARLSKAQKIAHILTLAPLAVVERAAVNAQAYSNPVRSGGPAFNRPRKRIPVASDAQFRSGDTNGTPATVRSDPRRFARHASRPETSISALNARDVASARRNARMESIGLLAAAGASPIAIANSLDLGLETVRAFLAELNARAGDGRTPEISTSPPPPATKLQPTPERVARIERGGERNSASDKAKSRIWESTGLVARTVFKTAEAGATRLVGSIPTLSRQAFVSSQ